MVVIAFHLFSPLPCWLCCPLYSSFQFLLWCVFLWHWFPPPVQWPLVVCPSLYWVAVPILFTVHDSLCLRRAPDRMRCGEEVRHTPRSEPHPSVHTCCFSSQMKARAACGLAQVGQAERPSSLDSLNQLPSRQHSGHPSFFPASWIHWLWTDSSTLCRNLALHIFPGADLSFYFHSPHADLAFLALETPSVFLVHWQHLLFIFPCGYGSIRQVDDWSLISLLSFQRALYGQGGWTDTCVQTTCWIWISSRVCEKIIKPIFKEQWTTMLEFVTWNTGVIIFFLRCLM